MVKLCASLDGSFKALRLEIGFLLRDNGSQISTIPNATMISARKLFLSLSLRLEKAGEFFVLCVSESGCVY